MQNHTTWRRWLAVGAVVIIVSIIALGHNGHSALSDIRLVPFQEYAEFITCLMQGCGGMGSWFLFLVADSLGNLVIFMPLGATLDYALKETIPLDRQRISLVALAGGLLSISYETIQLWIPGRVTSINDVIINTTGTLLGAALAIGLRAYRQKPVRGSIRNRYVG